MKKDILLVIYAVSSLLTGLLFLTASIALIMIREGYVIVIDITITPYQIFVYGMLACAVCCTTAVLTSLFRQPRRRDG